MDEFKKDLILGLAEDIKKYIDYHYAIDIDEYHVAEIVNINIGFLFDVAETTLNGDK